MTKFETITNDQMNETSRSPTSVFGLSHCFVICLLIFTTSPAFAQKRNITEKDLFDFVWTGDPKVSPDGKQIAFTSSTNADDLKKQEKKKKREEELKKAGSAEASASPNASASAKPPATSPSPAAQSAKPNADAAMAKPESEFEHESDVRVITRAVYREDNEGYTDPKHPSHIWIVNAPKTADEKVQPKQLTSGRFDEGG